MSANVTGNEKMVTLDCAQCGKPFDQPYGFVTMQVCEHCIGLLALAFWATMGGRK